MPSKGSTADTIPRRFRTVANIPTRGTSALDVLVSGKADSLFSMARCW
jgi:hypothetical protein